MRLMRKKWSVTSCTAMDGNQNVLLNVTTSESGASSECVEHQS